MMLKRQRNTMVVGILFVLTLCVILVRFNSREINKIIKWTKRRTAIQFMAIFHISPARGNGCLIKNRFMNGKKNVAQECDMCESMDRFTVFNTTGDDTIINEITRHIHNERPVLVHNTTNYWSDESESSDSPINEIADSITELPSMLTYKQCQYHSNMRSRYSELPQLLNYVLTDTGLPFYTFWENCAPIAIKEFRTFYKRPPFLGGHVQLTGSNWMVLCRDYVGKMYRQIELFSSFVVVMVKAGEINVRLEPAEECEGICDSLERTLEAGDTLMFSSNIYLLFYKPVCDDMETVVVGVSGYVD